MVADDILHVQKDKYINFSRNYTIFCYNLLKEAARGFPIQTSRSYEEVIL